MTVDPAAVFVAAVHSSFRSLSFAMRGSPPWLVAVRLWIGVVERLAADRAEPGAVGPAERL